MSSNQSAGSFENRMQDISDYLKTRVIDPAEAEKDRILEEAQAEKKKILDEARNEAETIVQDAKKQAEQEKASLESALRIAARQAVDSLKIALENEVLKKSIEEPTSNVLSSEEAVKESLKEIIDIYLNKGTESVELVLSDGLKQKLSDYVKSEISSNASQVITVSDDTVPAGFSVKLSDKQLVYDFSQESLVQLLSQYLRPELREYLFSK